MEPLITEIFQNKKSNSSKLTSFGFSKSNNGYIYRRMLDEIGFQMEVFVDSRGEISAKVTDPVLQEPYTLHLVKNSSGSFVGTVKDLYEQTLLEIASKCFDRDVFHTVQARAVIAYVLETYGDELEFLWKKFPNNAIWRRKDNRKWYAALISVSKRKLGIDSDENAEILDLCASPDTVKELIDCKTYFPAYHMNKEHWYTLLLDGSASLDEIYQRIETSYQMVKSK